MATHEPGRLTVSALPPRLQLSAWTGAVNLHKALAQIVPEPVDLWITDNRSVLYSVKRQSGRCRIRLHHMFTGADEHTLAALGTLSAKTSGAKTAVKAARAQLRRFAEEHNAQIRLPTPKTRVRLRTAGKVHDLEECFDKVLAEHFEGRAEGLKITWSRWGRPHKSQSRIRLGSFDPRRQLIRIHPVLDQHDVQVWVVNFIIFHEILHREVPSVRSAGRFVHHGEAFRAREAEHPDSGRFDVWMREALPALVSGMKVAPEVGNV